MKWANLTLPQALVLSVATLVLGGIVAFVPEGNAKLVAAAGFITTVIGTLSPTRKDFE